jgi:putative transcription factor
MVMSARRLEETDELKHAKVDKSLSKAIMQARTAKKMTQKDLATAINEKPQVIAEYESGKAIPNGAIIVKIERKLGCKLPRPGKKSAPSKTSSTGGTTGGPRVGGRTGTTRGGPAKRR